MRWSGRRGSSNIEDRRGVSPGIVAGGGIGTVVLALIALALGVDPSVVLQQAAPTSHVSPANSAQDDEMKQFVSVVLADTENVWTQIFQQEMQRDYPEPTLVLFSGAVQSACGFAQAAMGPFYCPGDQKVYIDLSFYQELKQRLQAPGDFAQAYVIAHEVGHHVQNLLGISEKVQARSRQLDQTAANALSVRLELQADCFAGVWAKKAESQWQILEPGDVDEALTAASAIGDDALQKQAQGYVVPDSFTHGSSKQRVRWFKQGFAAGEPDACDTFNADSV